MRSVGVSSDCSFSESLHGRDARCAQSGEKRREHRDPGADHERDDHGARFDHSPGGREIDPERIEERPDRRRETDPGQQSEPRCQQSDHDGLGDDGADDLTPVRTERPKHRELASALGHRDREGVEDEERGDEQRHPREDEKGGVEEADELADILLLRLDVFGPGLDLNRAGHRCFEVASEDLRRRAGAGGDIDRIKPALLACDPLGLWKGEQCQGCPAERIDLTERGDADELVGARLLLAGDLDLVAHREPLVVGRRLVDDDLVVGLRGAALHVLERVKALVFCRGETKGRRSATPTGFAVGSDYRHLRIGDPALCRLDAVGSADVLQDRRVEGRERAVVRLDDLTRCDHRVDAHGRLGEDLLKRPIDRVGEDVGPRDHHHAEHDRQRGEEGAQLARAQVSQRDRAHQASSAGCRIRSWTCSGLTAASSRTILPSTSISTRSAVAAACAS